jgi:hypothetical protein
MVAAAAVGDRLDHSLSEQAAPVSPPLAAAVALALW